MVNSLPIWRTTTDATGIIPARLGVGATTSMYVGTGGLLVVPILVLPSWIPVPVADAISPEPEISDLAPMSPVEAGRLMQLDESHNPLLADLWRDDMNDSLVDNP